jgi:hypothetical protein
MDPPSDLPPLEEAPLEPPEEVLPEDEPDVEPASEPASSSVPPGACAVDVAQAAAAARTTVAREGSMRIPTRRY